MRTDAYDAARRCTAARPDGTPCRAFAAWDDPGQRCVVHAGRHHRGPMAAARANAAPIAVAVKPARPPACNCPAYPWPHRPASGLCRWPLSPAGRSTTPAGTHKAGWTRRKGVGAKWRRLLGVKTRAELREWVRRHRSREPQPTPAPTHARASEFA